MGTRKGASRGEAEGSGWASGLARRTGGERRSASRAVILDPWKGRETETGAGASVAFAGLHFGLFLVGVDLEAYVDVIALGDGFQDAADGRGAEAIAADEEGDVGLAEDELEAQALGPEFGDLELGLGGELDELDGDVLEKIPDLIGNQLHVPIMPRSGERARRERGIRRRD